MASEAQFVDAGAAQSLLADRVNAGQPADLARAQRHRPVIALVGMAFEARIAEGPGVHVFSRDSRRELALAAANAARHGYRGIISFGVAGGLAAGLHPGDWVVASAIVDRHRSRATDAAWSKNLLAAIGEAHYAPIIGVDMPVAEPTSKRELHRTTGAAAVDMESHVVAQLAADHGLAFAALRVIADPAHRAIPSAALRGMGAGPRADGAAVLRDLMARPSQLPRLVRVSFDALIARSEMIRVRQLLGTHFGHPDTAHADLLSADSAGLDAAAYRSPA
jgi:adenosylhomocysteine nucleosidase